MSRLCLRMLATVRMLRTRWPQVRRDAALRFQWTEASKRERRRAGYALLSVLVTLAICGVAVTASLQRASGTSAASRAATASVVERWSALSVQAAVEPALPKLAAKTNGPGGVAQLVVSLGGIDVRAWLFNDARRLQLATLDAGSGGDDRRLAEVLDRVITDPALSRRIRIRRPEPRDSDAELELDEGGGGRTGGEALMWSDVITGLTLEEMLETGGVAHRLAVSGPAGEASRAEAVVRSVQNGTGGPGAAGSGFPPAREPVPGRADASGLSGAPTSSTQPAEATSEAESPAGPHTMWIHARGREGGRGYARVLIFSGAPAVSDADTGVAAAAPSPADRGGAARGASEPAPETPELIAPNERRVLEW